MITLYYQPAHYTEFNQLLIGKILTLKAKNITMGEQFEGQEKETMMITALYAGILGILYVGLSAFVIRGRWKNRVSLGDGDNQDMIKRIRVHANFIEYVPFALILMFLLETEGASATLIHGLGVALVTGRIIHPIGILTKFGPSWGRTGGMILTFGVILIGSLYAIGSFLGI